MNNTLAPKAPWHIWVVGIVGLLWNAYGAYDYVMSKTQGEAYFQSLGMTEGQIAHYHAMPAWMTAVWAVGVWGAVAGTVLLLLRSRLAVEVFIASLIGFIISLVYAYLIAPMPDAPSIMPVIQGVILAGCLFFAWYAWAQRKAGVLG
jgi:predicted lysophospholipase L1 biosynthesis ABC-type transport system permease subunit